MPRRPRKSERVFKKRRNVGMPLLRVARPSADQVSDPRPTPVRKPRSFEGVDSASKKKLGDLDLKYDAYNKEENVNIIVSLELLSNALSQFVSCSSCGSASIRLTNPSNVGLASNLELSCTSCMASHRFMSSAKVNLPETNQYAINARLYSLRFPFNR